MKKRFTALVIFFLFIASVSLSAQRLMSDTTINSLIFQASYGLHGAGGDLGELYGLSSSIGGMLSYKTTKNWMWTAHGSFIFGNQVKGRETILKDITTSEGELIDGNGTYTSLALFQRGVHVEMKAAKVFSFNLPNPNSGIYISTGLGYLAQRIRIESQFGTAPQVMGDYAKGYDRLRGGLAHSVEAGYLVMSNSRVLNFSLGFEFIQAFTKSLRDYQFDLMQADPNHYKDHYFGLRLSWMIPAYQRAPQKFYYY